MGRKGFHQKSLFIILVNCRKERLMKKKRKTLREAVPWILLFAIGMSIALYPLVTRVIYYESSKKQIEEFDRETKQLEKDDVERRMNLAEAYNRTLDPATLQDPFTTSEKEGVKEYARMLEVKEKLGYISIPRLRQEIPIYAGTSEDVLEKGTGHLEGTSLPVGGKSAHTVITGHRGLADKTLFRHLDKMQKGDRFYIKNIRDTLCYQVDSIETIEPEDFGPVMVREGEDECTLVTCTPYMVNSHRLLVHGHRVPFEKKEKVKNYILPIAVLAIVSLITILILITRRFKRRNR